MKARIGILVILIALANIQIAYACQIQFDSEADRVLLLGGDTLRGNFATEAECLSYWRSSPWFEQKHSRCVGCDRSSSGSTDTPSGSSSANRDRGRRGGNTATATATATAEKKRQEVFDRAKNELTMGLKGGISAGVPGLKTGTPALPLKGSGNSQAIGLKTYGATIKEKTIKAIKELNCSAYWGLNSAKVAMSSMPEAPGMLEDKYTLARQYGEYSAMAKDGQSVSGCPEVKISVPDVSPPVEVNPQIKFYKHIIEQTDILVPKIIENQQKIEQTKKLIKKNDEDKSANLRKKKELEEEIANARNEKEKEILEEKKKENEKKQPDLEELAKKLKEEGDQEIRTADELGKREAVLEQSYDVVTKDPQSAEKLLEKVRWE